MEINKKSLPQWGDDLNARLEGTPDYAALGGRYAVSSLLGITFRIDTGPGLARCSRTARRPRKFRGP
jgi:hypothetical protein